MFSQNCIGDVTERDWSECRINLVAPICLLSCKHLYFSFQSRRVADNNTPFIIKVADCFPMEIRCSYPSTLQYVSSPPFFPLSKLAVSLPSTLLFPVCVCQAESPVIISTKKNRCLSVFIKIQQWFTHFSDIIGPLSYLIR